MHLRNLKNTIAAVLLGLGLVAGGITIALAGPSISLGNTSSHHDSSDVATPCAQDQDSQGDDSENASATPESEHHGHNHGHGRGHGYGHHKHGNGNGYGHERGRGHGHDDDGSAPGALVEGQDLQSQATISLDQAVATAQGVATGDLGSVSLDNEDGTLVYEVEIGEQDVVIDATSGDVLDITSGDDQD